MHRLNAHQWQALRRLARSVIGGNLMQLGARIEAKHRDNSVVPGNARRLINTRLRILSDVSQVDTLQSLIQNKLLDDRPLSFCYDDEEVDCLVNYREVLLEALRTGFDASLQVNLTTTELNALRNTIDTLNE